MNSSCESGRNGIEMAKSGNSESFRKSISFLEFSGRCYGVMYILDGLGIHLGCDSVWFNEENGVLHCYFYFLIKLFILRLSRRSRINQITHQNRLPMAKRRYNTHPKLYNSLPKPVSPPRSQGSHQSAQQIAFLSPWTNGRRYDNGLPDVNAEERHPTQTPGLFKGNAITMKPPGTAAPGPEAGIVTTSRRVGLINWAVSRTLSSNTPTPSAINRKSCPWRCI